MATHNWIIVSGPATWQAASFDSGVLPANGDTVNILQGAADISAGLNQSAVTLAVLNMGGSFQGTIGLNASSGDALQIGATNWTCNCGAGRIRLDFGAVTHTGVVQKTGRAIDGVLPALQIRGGTNTSKLYVVGDGQTTVGVATARGGITATLLEWDVEGGNLTIGAGATWTNGYQNGGSVTALSGGTLIQQSGNDPILTTGGAGTITTLNVTGTCFANNRPASADAIGTATLGPGATLDCRGDPRVCLFTNPLIMAKDGKLFGFSPTQLKLTGPNPIVVKMQQCGLADVVIDLGAQTQATLTSW